jgi:hypothetical protein
MYSSPFQVGKRSLRRPSDRQDYAASFTAMTACVLLCKLIKTKTQTALLLAKPTPPNINLSSGRFAMFNKKSGTFPRKAQERPENLLIRP